MSRSPVPPAPASVLVVEDDPLIAEHLQSALTRWGWRVTAVVDTVAEALRAVRRDRPDLALVDVSLERAEDGIVLGGELREAHGVSVVFVTGHDDPAVHRRAAEALPLGFVSKPFTDAQLYGAVTVAMRQALTVGAQPAQRDALERIAAVMRDAGFCSTEGLRRRAVPGLERLSEREREVLELLVQNVRPPSIAAALHISAHTVRNHLKNVYAKLEVHSQQELLDLLLR